MLKLIINNINFEVIFLDNKHFNILEAILPILTTFKFNYDVDYKKYRLVKDKEYFLKINNSYFFSINILKDFILTIKKHGINMEDIIIEDRRGIIDSKYTLKFKDTLKARDYQTKYIDAIKNSTSRINLVDLATGYGKTFIALKVACDIGERVGVVVLPKYINKWIKDVKQHTHIKEHEIYIIKGLDSLNNIRSINFSKIKVVIISLRTMLNYIKLCEESNIDHNEMDSLLKLGLIISDESHQEFHALFKFLLFFNANKVIGLTATLTSNDNYTLKMQNILFPKENRISNIIEYDKYINIYAVSYNIDSLRGIRYTQHQRGYNHILFEQSIMKNNRLLHSYLDMIFTYLKDKYLLKRQEGDKCLIFASSVDMCKQIKNYIVNNYKNVINKTLTINKYTQGDDFNNIINSDICVSTLISSGTAIDIKGLTTIIQTICVKSKIANLQSLGRLRRIDNKDVNFYYLYCNNIDKHVNNNKIRFNDLFKYAKEYKLLYHDKTLKSKG